MKTQVIEYPQGSEAWHAHRAAHFNASDSAAMLGLSSYKTRSQLLKEKSTGLVAEINSAMEYRFAKGHEFEATARPWAEEIIGGELYPVVLAGELDGLKLSASLDGLSLDDVAWEHKTGNAGLLASLEQGIIPAEYHPQMEMGLLLSGAEKCLFMASSGVKDSMRFAWYESVPARRAQLIAGWKQFAADLASHQHTEPATKVEAEVVEQLPAVVINVTGQLSASNLADVTPKFDAYLTSTKTELATDHDFANGESNAKFSRATAKALKTKAKEVVDQIASISDAVRTLELYAGKFDALGLKLEKAVKDQKELIKTNLINAARDKLREHCAKLDERIGKRYLPIVQGNWNEVVKNKRTIESLRNAIDTELARAKIEASEVADRIEINLNLAGLSDYPLLFSDIATLCLKANDDFAAVAAARIQAHKAQEDERAKAKAKPVTEVPFVSLTTAPQSIGIGRSSFASEIINTTADAERARLNTLLDRLTANEISKVLSFVKDLCRQAA